MAKRMLSVSLYPPDLFLAEKELAYYLVRLLCARVQKVEALVEGLKFKQPQAVVNACEKSVSILTGPPGTGKTTTLRMAVESFLAAGLSMLVVSPTGKAAKRAYEVINAGREVKKHIHCSTVHAALQFDGASQGFTYNRWHLLPYDVVIMDEFSMADCELMRDFIEAIQPGVTRVVFCGDQYQLPSVGPGNVARDLMNCGVIPTVELDVVLRTGANSGITANANNILRGQDICKTDVSTGNLYEDFFMVPRTEEADTVKDIVKWVKEDIPARRGVHPLMDIQVMVPGKVGLVGRKNLNKTLRDALNPGSDKPTVGGYRVGDKVINLKNDKKLYIVNGDSGFVVEVVRGQSGSHLVVDFGLGTGPRLDGKIEMKGELISRLQMNFAQTVHKSQGSEYPVAIMPMHRCHTRLLTRNLLYTGLTRAKMLGVLVGQYEAVKYAIKNTITERRLTGLTDEIKRQWRDAQKKLTVA